MDTVRDRLLAAGLNLPIIEVDCPTGEIGKLLNQELWVNIDSNLDPQSRGDLLDTCSVVSKFVIYSYSFGGERVIGKGFENPPIMYRGGAASEFYIDEWYNRLIMVIKSRVGTSNEVIQLLWHRNPEILRHTVYTVDPLKYEEVRLTTGLNERVFSRADIVEMEFVNVLGRLKFITRNMEIVK